MNPFSLTTLEYEQIKARLAEYTVSGLGKKLVERLQPYTDLAAIGNAMRETTEAAALLASSSQVPLHGLSDITEPVERAAREGILGASDLLRIGDLLRGSSRMKKYMKGKHSIVPYLSTYAEGIENLTDLEETIEICIEGARVSNSASQKLANIRSQMKVTEARIQEKLNSLLASAQLRDCLQESYVSLKDGRYVVLVKAAFKHRVNGVVIGASGSGSTVFIEPAAVRRLADELAVLRSAEEAEEYQVLSMLTGEVALHLTEIRRNIEIMAAYDFALAKGKYGRSLEGNPVEFNPEGRINLKQGRHPLIERDPVPLDFYIGEGYHILVITGPNTGGKTVALKTIGLLTLMAMSGLHIPAAPGTELAVFDRVLADIGDGQNIQQSLSTFSAHIRNIVAILAAAGPDTLILLDEIGTGTDPAEGAALAAAILDELRLRGATAVVSTHFSDIKRYAAVREGFCNGCMEFDRESLQPLYRLKIGEAGSSNALWIAEKLGMEPAMLQRARGYLEQQPEARHLDATAGESASAAAPVSATRPTGLRSRRKVKPPQPVPKHFAVGDCVFVHKLNRRGIICEPVDAKGMYAVLCRGEKIMVNHKRLTFFAAKEDLYPEDYDMNIILRSKEERRLIRAMEKQNRDGRTKVSGALVIKEGKGD